MNATNTLFVILASILVFFMIPGLALFYGGLVSKRNTVNTMLMVFIPCGLSVVLWVICGYTLSFSGGANGLIGNLDHLLMHGIPLGEVTATKIPTQVFSLFQMMFAIITPALFIGAIVGRMRTSYLISFILLWSILVYYPLVHLVWGGGFLSKLGTLDFAGGTVVHINAGITALVLSSLVGPRKEPGCTYSNLALVLIGTAILWIGWYGFNAGSALALDDNAVTAILTTTVSPATALLGWAGLDYLFNHKITLAGACTGAVCGLVAITPAAAYVDLTGAFFIGLGASLISFSYIKWLKPRVKADDALDVFGCHGVSGIWGSIATGLFALKGGLFYGGGFKQVGIQIIATLFTIVFTLVMTTLIGLALKRLMPIRVSQADEFSGLDAALHGEQVAKL
ncbi:ammonium transporter [Lactobacillus corticis]|uniref:Ammonium transporter n=1 Tax=Lactobacillus corticis TaxID=2201249 RepID=A0A916QIV4_9LACO|nr:ammonium transporter [Lactobacillus corticis]GFZ26298.1 ammonium transporter [Lactobacillus corticis]